MTTPASTDALAAASGRSWAAWIATLEEAGGAHLDHRGLVAAALAELGHVDNPRWWAQSVAVAYEHYIGRRAPGQRQDGTFEGSVSRTHGGTLDDAMDAWRALVAGVTVIAGVPLQGEPKETSTARYRRWRASMADGTRILAQVSLRGTRAVITTTWERLPDSETLEERRIELGELLDCL